MIITTKTPVAELKKYDLLIGWGVGRNEYVKKYNPCLFTMDYMIDVDEKLEGKTICGMKISNAHILDKLADKYICFIVFPNIEQAVEQEAAKYVKKYDIIISSLIENRGGIFTQRAERIFCFCN